MNKKKELDILFVIPALSSGGAERVMTMLANHWSLKNNQITIISIGNSENDFYQLHSNVNRISLDLLKESKTFLDSIKNNIQRITKLRDKIREIKPDIIISFLPRTNIYTIIANKYNDIPLIISERSNPEKYNINVFWKLMRKLTYKEADEIIVQTKEVENWIKKKLKCKNTTIIENPIDLSRFISKETNKSKSIVAMGRLVTLKGFDNLIKAFSKLAQLYPEWDLIIIGEGPEKERLTNLVNEYNVTEKVKLLGRMNKPEEIIMKSEIFVLSSRHEGFPNSLIEAMACGTAIVSTDCDHGPRDIITHNYDGVLVDNDNIDKLKIGIEKLIVNTDLRNKIRKNALETVLKYDLNKISLKWEEIFKEKIK